jgi:hypothetical protein
MNAISRNILITALFNPLFLNLKNRDGFPWVPDTCL